MAGNRPEEKVKVTLPMVHQSWRHVSFLHWRYEADAIQQMLPDGLRPQLVDGSAWVGLTPFQVEGFRLHGTPALPLVSKFPETNLRTRGRHHAVREPARRRVTCLLRDRGAPGHAARRGAVRT